MALHTFSTDRARYTMPSTLRLAATSGLVLLVCAVTGPGVCAADKAKVAVVTSNPAPFWDLVEKGAKDAADKAGVDLTFRKPDKPEAGQQEDIFKDLVRAGVKGIAVSVINPKEQTPALKEVAKKTHLITMDNDAPDSGRLTFVGTDNYEAGKAAGRLVKEAMPDGGTVPVFVGMITPENPRLRFQGLLDELAGEKNAKGPKYGRYTLYRNEAITDNARRETAIDNAADALQKLAEEKNVCLVGLWAYNAPAALEAAKARAALDKVKIVAFDEDPVTLTAVEKGEIYATVVHDPYQYGFRSVELLAELAKADGVKFKLASRIHVPVRIVTKDGGKDRVSVKDFQADVRKKLGK
jgi:ribose transport system substrate-binding protein